MNKVLSHEVVSCPSNGVAFTWARSFIGLRCDTYGDWCSQFARDTSISAILSTPFTLCLTFHSSFHFHLLETIMLPAFVLALIAMPSGTFGLTICNGTAFPCSASVSKTSTIYGYPAGSFVAGFSVSSVDECERKCFKNVQCKSYAVDSKNHCTLRKHVIEDKKDYIPVPLKLFPSAVVQNSNKSWNEGQPTRENLISLKGGQFNGASVSLSQCKAACDAHPICDKFQFDPKMADSDGCYLDVPVHEIRYSKRVSRHSGFGYSDTTANVHRNKNHDQLLKNFNACSQKFTNCVKRASESKRCSLIQSQCVSQWLSYLNAINGSN